MCKILDKLKNLINTKVNTKINTEKHKTNGDSSPIISVNNGDSSPIISVNNANNNNIMNNINVIPQVSNEAIDTLLCNAANQRKEIQGISESYKGLKKNINNHKDNDYGHE